MRCIAWCLLALLCGPGESSLLIDRIRVFLSDDSTTDRAQSGAVGESVSSDSVDGGNSSDDSTSDDSVRKSNLGRRQQYEHNVTFEDSKVNNTYPIFPFSSIPSSGDDFNQKPKSIIFFNPSGIKGIKIINSSNKHKSSLNPSELPEQQTRSMEITTTGSLTSNVDKEDESQNRHDSSASSTSEPDLSRKDPVPVGGEDKRVVVDGPTRGCSESNKKRDQNGNCREIVRRSIDSTPVSEEHRMSSTDPEPSITSCADGSLAKHCNLPTEPNVIGKNGKEERTKRSISIVVTKKDVASTTSEKQVLTTRIAPDILNIPPRNCSTGMKLDDNGKCREEARDINTVKSKKVGVGHTTMKNEEEEATNEDIDKFIIDIPSCRPGMKLDRYGNCRPEFSGGPMLSNKPGAGQTTEKSEVKTTTEEVDKFIVDTPPKFCGSGMKVDNLGICRPEARKVDPELNKRDDTVQATVKDEAVQTTTEDIDKILDTPAKDCGPGMKLDDQGNCRTEARK